MVINERLREKAKPAAGEAREAAAEARRRAVERSKRAAKAVADAEPKRGRGRMDDDSRAMFRNAERATTAAPPVDATLDPLSGPEQLGDFVRGGTGDSEGRDASVDMLVTGPPADNGGMMELVMGGGAGPDDAPMEAFVTGRDATGQDREPRVDDMVRGRGGER